VGIKGRIAGPGKGRTTGPRWRRRLYSVGKERGNLPSHSQTERKGGGNSGMKRGGLCRVPCVAEFI